MKKLGRLVIWVMVFLALAGSVSTAISASLLDWPGDIRPRVTVEWYDRT